VILGDYYMYKKLLKISTTIGAGTTRNVGSAISLILLISVLPAWAGTTSLALSEPEAIRFGLDRAEITQQMQASIEFAESDIVEASTWVNPEFSYDQQYSNDGPDNVTERSYMLSQEFDMSGRRAIRTEAARQRLDVVNQENSQWQMERTAEIRQHFYAVLYQQQLHDIFSKWRAGIDAMKIVMHKRMEAGDISGYDLGRLKREQSFVLARQRQAHAEHERLTQELLAIIGLVDGDLPLSGVTGSLLPQTPPMSLEKLLGQIAEQPDLLAMNLQRKAYATDERLAQRWWLPDVTIGVGVKDVDNADGDAVLFTASLPIPIFDRSSAAQQRAKASGRQLQNKYHLAFSEREGMIRGLWHQASELAKAARPLADEDGCRSLVNTAEVAYKAGEIGVLEIIDAYRIAFENRSQILSLMREARMVRIELDLISGGNTQ
jgi:outer membrane protein, heavy metal efflux system